MNQTAILQTAPVGYIPNYFLYIEGAIIILSIIILTYIYRSKNGIKFENYFKVITFTVIIAAIIIIGLALTPEVFTNFIDKLTEIWTNL